MPLTTTPQRCPHQTPDTYRLGAIFCPSCGWVKNGYRMTTEQVIAEKHPELLAQAKPTQPPPKPRWFEEGSAFNLTADLLGAVGRLIMWFFVLLIFLFFAAVIIGAYVHF